jgi:hypothetical protein
MGWEYIKPQMKIGIGPRGRQFLFGQNMGGLGWIEFPWERSAAKRFPRGGFLI